VALAALPRGNQVAASAVAVRRGLTVRQTELFVAQILQHADETKRAELIELRLRGTTACESRPIRRAIRSEADWMAADVATLLRVAARLEARLMARPLDALGSEAADVILDGLVALTPVLTALRSTVRTVTGEENAA
jgi:hypothetical protein